MQKLPSGRQGALPRLHAIAAIAARTQSAAQNALALIDVKYELLPPVMDVEAAMKEDAPVLHADMFHRRL
ncbi:MAG: hypothetical protein ACNYPE_15925 [Candidatus Azotimanducaceae bacterium WSBS_2022_MAG_OTU7]